MAPADRPTAHHLSYVATAQPAVKRWGLFPLLRRFEALAPKLPRIGRARLPKSDIVEIGQSPSLGFSPATVASIEVKRGRASVSNFALGLLGPMGALPMHLTEYAQYENRYAKGRPFGRFLDLISGRMLQFFYRAWADSQPVTYLDRPGDDRFANYIATLSGAHDGASEDSAFPPQARLHYAGFFASRRSAVGLQDALSHLLGQPLTIQQFQPRWQSIEPADRSRLGRDFCELGTDAILGSQVRTVTDAFRVVIRAQTHRDYLSLMPPGKRFAIAAEALDAFAPSHLEWDLAVEIAGTQAPPTKLDGKGRLGWTSWIGKDTNRPIRSDAHLRRGSRTRKREAVGSRNRGTQQ
ncbi:MAG: type VI secretion system baseplate subunit TssG [Novosphingobium sp.]